MQLNQRQSTQLQCKNVIMSKISTAAMLEGYSCMLWQCNFVNLHLQILSYVLLHLFPNNRGTNNFKCLHVSHSSLTLSISLDIQHGGVVICSIQGRLCTCRTRHDNFRRHVPKTVSSK